MNEDKFKSNKKNKEKEGYGLLYNLKDNIKKDNYQKDYNQNKNEISNYTAKTNNGIEDSEKNTPLHLICKNNNVELLRYVLTKSPLINSKNIYGKTPRDLATNSKIKNLLDKNIKMNEDKLLKRIKI